MITKLETEISNDPVTGLKRKLVHHKLEIDENLEMTHYRKIVYYERLDGDVYGRPIIEAIQENDQITDEAKKKLTEKYQPQFFNVDTRGVYVNPETGQPVNKIVSVDENGNQTESYPIGSVPELEFWQNLPISFIQPTPTTNSGVVYGLLQMSMKSADNNGRV